MARLLRHALTARKVETAKPGRYTDGHGLHLLVKASGARSWVLRCRHEGTSFELGLGSFPTVTLAEAREKAMALRRQIKRGVDPRAEKAKRQASRRTFREVAEAWLASQQQGWRNAKHRQQVANTLATYAYPSLGAMDVRAIAVEHVVAVLQPIWAEKTETATRLRQRIEAVLDYAGTIRARSGENPAIWRGNLDHVLAKPAKVKRERHHAALSWGAMGGFFPELQTRSGVAAMALQFAILTAARSGEVRGMTWRELDLSAGLWVVPAARMKAEIAHRVPLSPPALAILQSFGPGTPDALVFPGARAGKPMSDMTLAAVLKRMGRDDITVHGFRSSFRDWCAEAISCPRELAEACLAHRLTSKVEAAYQRGDQLDKRRLLMIRWAQHCLSGHGGQVIPLIGGGGGAAAGMPA